MSERRHCANCCRIFDCKIQYSFNRFINFEHVRSNIDTAGLLRALAENCKLYKNQREIKISGDIE